MQSRSRGAPAPELCQTATTTMPPERTKREAERRKAPTNQPRHTFRCCHLKVLRARRAPRMIRSHEPLASGALAFRRSTAALVAGRTLTTRLRPRFTRSRREGVTFAFAIALKPSTWLAGHNASGDDARTARERSVSPRPQEPPSLPSVEYPRPKGPSLIRARWRLGNMFGD